MIQTTATGNTPKVSVVMAAYNRAHLLPHAIRSIINQTLTNWELIIIDDASSDNTPEVVRAFTKIDPRIRYHRHQHNSGLAVARNTSFELARGTYIALQDDDDISLPHRLQTQADFLRQNPHVHLISSSMQNFDRNGFKLTKPRKPWLSDAATPASIDSLAVMPIISGCSMGHRHVFTSLLMRPFFSVVEDYDFVLRCAENYTIARIPECLYHYRVADEQNITLSTSPSRFMNIWHYHLAAWISAYHRRNGMADPIRHGRTIDQVLHDAPPVLKNLSGYPLRKLILSRGRHALSLSLKHNDLSMCHTTLTLILRYSTYRSLCRIVLRLIPKLTKHPHRVAFYREILRALLFPRLLSEAKNLHITP